MENKQTAVEWLKNNLEQYGYSSRLDILWDTFDELFDQAKEMEKEQHGETWDAALIHVDKRGGVLLRALVDFDEYWEKYQKV